MIIVLYILGLLTGASLYYLATLIYKTWKDDKMTVPTNDAAFRQIIKY